MKVLFGIKSLCLSLSLLILSGCATTHPGTKGNAVNGVGLPLEVSAISIEPTPEEAFQLIELTFENKSNNWLRIHSSDVVLNDLMRTKVSVVLGSDLRDWAQAMEFKLNKDEHNRGLLQAAIIGAGAIAAGSNDKNIAAVGAVTAVGG